MTERELEKNTPRLGIVGLGHIHEWQAQALELENIPVVATCDKDLQKAILHPDAQFLTDADQLLAIPEVDAILVAVPNAQHFTIAKAALEAGKHVLLEKPATSSLDELRELYQLADNRGRRLIIAFHAAFAIDLEWYINNREKADQGEKIVGFECGFYDPYVTRGELQPQAINLGGSWTDSGVNALSVIARILPGLQITASRFTSLPGFAASELQATVDFEFPVEGREMPGSGSIDTNWTLGINQKGTLLTFESGRKIILDHMQQAVFKRTAAQRADKLDDLSGDHPRLTAHYIGVFRDFRRHLANGTDNRDFSILVHRLLFDARQPGLPK